MDSEMKKSKDAKPNIIFILQDHQAYYGHGDYEGGVKPLRPCFEAFAETGAEFVQTRCVTPMCGPARRSLLTGLYPHTHAQVHNENDPPYDHEVYLDTLAEHGYHNLYFGKWHAGPGSASEHSCEGFSRTSYGNPYVTEEYQAYLKRHNLPPARHAIDFAFTTDSYSKQGYFPGLEEGAEYQCKDAWCGEHAAGLTVTPKETHEAFFLASLACDALEQVAKDDSHQPFCMNLHFWGPHQPFFPTQEFLDLYDPSQIGRYPSFDDPLTDQPQVLKTEVSRPLTEDGKTLCSPNPMAWERWQHLLAYCYAHISMIDAAGGKVIDKVRELGLDENTLIIWGTDHGDALACHGGHFDKDSHMVEEVMRIPLAISWKNHIKAGTLDDRLAFTCDIPATILAAAGTAFGKRVDGKSLLTDASEPWRTSLMCESYGHGYGVTIRSRMVVKGPYKYVATEDDLEQLYDLQSDPYELDNLALKPSCQDLKKAMQEEMRLHQQLSLDPVILDELVPSAEEGGRS